MSYSGVDPTMSPEEGRMNQVSWIEDLFSSIDRMDTDAFMGFLSDAPVFQFGNAPPVEGRSEVQAAVAGFFGAISGIEHRLAGSWQIGDAAFSHGRVTYTRGDGSQLDVPFATVFRLDGDRIRDYLIYVDASALFAPA